MKKTAAVILLVFLLIFALSCENGSQNCSDTGEGSDVTTTETPVPNDSESDNWCDFF